jgi:hypothetical protein
MLKFERHFGVIPVFFSLFPLFVDGAFAALVVAFGNRTTVFSNGKFTLHARAGVIRVKVAKHVVDLIARNALNSRRKFARLIPKVPLFRNVKAKILRNIVPIQPTMNIKRPLSAALF